MTLRVPDAALLPEYAAALGRGWSPSTVRDLAPEHLRRIGADPAAFLADVARTEGGGMILRPDGAEVPRLPTHVFWISDGAFCGGINLRYQPGTLELPAHVSGHAGYSVVPWKRGRGIATAALRLLLPVARAAGLPRLLLTCDEDNDASARVIARSGGVEVAGEAGKRLFWVSTTG